MGAPRGLPVVSDRPTSRDSAGAWTWWRRAAVKELLGPKLAGFTFGVSLTTVDRWASSKVTPGLDRERRVRAAYQILELLRPVEAAPTIRAWFIGMNPQLDDRAPAEAIAEGDLRETLAAARAFAAGG